MSGPSALERELRWAGAVLLPFLALLATLVAVALAAPWLGPRRAPGLAGAVEPALWLAIVTALPALAVVALVLARAGWLGRGFASRGDRLGAHVLACLVASAGLVMTCSAAGPGLGRVPTSILASLGLAGVVFALVYWPRHFTAFSGLEPPADAASAPSPRSGAPRRGASEGDSR